MISWSPSPFHSRPASEPAHSLLTDLVSPNHHAVHTSISVNLCMLVLPCHWPHKCWPRYAEISIICGPIDHARYNLIQSEYCRGVKESRKDAPIKRPITIISFNSKDLLGLCETLKVYRMAWLWMSRDRRGNNCVLSQTDLVICEWIALWTVWDWCYMWIARRDCWTHYTAHTTPAHTGTQQPRATGSRHGWVNKPYLVTDNPQSDNLMTIGFKKKRYKGIIPYVYLIENTFKKFHSNFRFHLSISQLNPKMYMISI